MRSAVVLLVLAAATTAYGQNPPLPGFYADVQFLWFDSPLKDSFGLESDNQGLSEFAPRFIVGYDDTVGARLRWWKFDRSRLFHSNVYLVDNVHLNFDVVDLEATTHFRHGASDFLLSGGARVAAIESSDHLVQQDGLTLQETTMAGVTLAGEGRTCITCNELWGTAFVYGGRLSLLAGDWHGRSDSVQFDPVTKDERFVVPEVFTGVEAHYGRAFTRLTVEMQDWRGSVELEGITRHSYGFTGVGFEVGFAY